MSAPAVSVVIPLYNKRATIRRALESVLAQSLQDFEIIVVDDGSTDGSADAARALPDPRITLHQQRNAGPGRARNVGAQLARAELLAFLDGDDEWKPDYLAAGTAALAEYPQAVAYACGYDAGAFADRVKDKVSELTTEPAALPPPTTALGPYRIKLALDGLHSSSTIVRRAAFERAGGYYDRERCLWGEDSYLWAQVLFMGPVFWDPAPRLLFHVEDSELGFARKQRDSARPLVIHGAELLRRTAPEHQPAFRMLVQRTAARDAEILMESGHVRQALQVRRQWGGTPPWEWLKDLKRYAKYTAHRLAARA